MDNQTTAELIAETKKYLVQDIPSYVAKKVAVYRVLDFILAKAPAEVTEQICKVLAGTFPLPILNILNEKATEVLAEIALDINAYDKYFDVPSVPIIFTFDDVQKPSVKPCITFSSWQFSIQFDKQTCTFIRELNVGYQQNQIFSVTFSI